MAEITSDAVIGFAKQGHPQAIAVLLNRALVPKGAHVKVRQKKELLKVLINFLREAELEQLVNRVQDTFNDLSPENIQRVQIFTQRLGDRQASFQKEIVTTANFSQKTSPPIDNAKSIASDLEKKSASEWQQKSASVNDKPHGKRERIGEQRLVSVDAKMSQHRYSVAEYLSQISSIEELNVLEDHPFFTGVCPKCSHDYANRETPPLFWDCQACGWQDDLSQKIPSHQLRETPQRQTIHQGKRLGSYLIDAGLLTSAQIEVALADQQLAGIRLGEVLVRRGWIKEGTVEYFMRKVVEPERQASSRQAEAYLESSRNLLKTLIQSQNHPQKSDSDPESTDISSSETIPGTGDMSEPPTHPSQVNQVNNKETLILSDVDLPAIKPKGAVNAVNERETLLLPDVDMHQLRNQTAE